MDPVVLSMLDQFERWMEQETLVTVCISGVDLLKEASRTLSEDEHRIARLPGLSVLTRRMLEELASRGELERWMSSDWRVGRISCRVPLGSAADLGAELERVEAEIELRFAGSTINLEPTGYGTLMVQMEHHLVRSQLITVSLAFAVVLLMLALLIRSWTVASIAMLPNLLPVLVGIGLMPILGISLNPGTVMVAAVALGIVVDDTAHLLVAMRRHLDCGCLVRQALIDAISDVGAPVLLTSLIMVGSMSVLTLGSFAPGVHFGLIAMIIVVVAVLADLWLLPRLLEQAGADRWLYPEKTERRKR